ncbi:MAG: LamG domain-containing protein [Planctomycetota bacterium]
MAVENTCDERGSDRSYLVFAQMAELSGNSIFIGHKKIFLLTKNINWRTLSALGHQIPIVATMWILSTVHGIMYLVAKVDMNFTCNGNMDRGNMWHIRSLTLLFLVFFPPLLCSADIVEDVLLIYLDTGNYFGTEQIWYDRSDNHYNAMLGDYTTGDDADPNLVSTEDGNVFEFIRIDSDTGTIIRVPWGQQSLGDFSAQTANFSIEMWVKCDPTTIGQTLLDMRDPTFPWSASGVVIKTGGTGRLQVQIFSGDDEVSTTHSTQAVWSSSRINHLVVTVDSLSDRLKIYVNRADRTDTSAYDKGDLQTHNAKVFCGDIGIGRSIDTSTTSLIPLNGQIATLRIYSQVLTSEQITQNYFEGFDILGPACVEQMPADLSGDCRVDLKDVNIFVGNWLAEYQSTAQKWQQGKNFAIGGICYFPVSYQDMNSLVESNLTVAVPRHAEDVPCQTLLNHGIEWMQSFNSWESVSHVKQDLDAYGDAPGNIACLITDEPTHAELGTTQQKIEYLKSTQPHLLSVLPLWGWVAGIYLWGDDSNPSYTYEQYLDDFIGTCDPDVVMFNQYACRSTGEPFRYSWFKNVDIVARKSQAAGKSYWNYVQAFDRSTGGNNYRLPSESELRLLAYTTLAYGYKGIVYYTYDQLPGNGPSFIDANGVRNEPFFTYGANLSAEIANLGPALLALKNNVVYFQVDVLPELMVSYDDATFKPFTLDDQGGQFIVSFFEDEQDNLYAMIVNYGMSPTATADELIHGYSLRFDTSISQIVEISRFTGDSIIHPLTFDPNSGKNILTASLPGGTGTLYKIELPQKRKVLLAEADSLIVNLDTGNFSGGQFWTDQSDYNNHGALGDCDQADNSDPVLMITPEQRVFEFVRQSSSLGTMIRIPELPLGSFADDSANFTIELWAQIDCNDADMVLFDNRYEITLGKGIMLRTFGEGTLQLRLVTNDGIATNHRTLPVVTSDSFHHIAVVCDSVSDLLRLYIDGVDQTDLINDDAGDVSSHNSILGGRDFGLGRTINTAITSYVPLNGKLAAFRFYDIALGQTAIQTNYEAGYCFAPKQICLEPDPGDINGDCIIDFKDFALFSMDWLECGLYPPDFCD